MLVYLERARGERDYSAEDKPNIGVTQALGAGGKPPLPYLRDYLGCNHYFRIESLSSEG